MVELEIKDIWSSDVEDLNTWIPEDSEDVFIQLYLAVGIDGDERADDFQALVGTPVGLKKWSEESDESLISDRNLLVYKEYSLAKLKQDLTRIVESCKAPTWEESTLKLQRYFMWEYDDYQTD